MIYGWEIIVLLESQFENRDWMWWSRQPWLILRHVEYYNYSNNEGGYSCSKEDDVNIINDDVSLYEDDIKSDLESIFLSGYSYDFNIIWNFATRRKWNGVWGYVWGLVCSDGFNSCKICRIYDYKLQ